MPDGENMTSTEVTRPTRGRHPREPRATRGRDLRRCCGLEGEGRASSSTSSTICPDGELEPGSTFDLFMPRSEGIYHWLLLALRTPEGQRAEFELLDFPMFVQRRRRHRVDAEVQARCGGSTRQRRGRRLRDDRRRTCPTAA